MKRQILLWFLLAAACCGQATIGGKSVGGGKLIFGSGGPATASITVVQHRSTACATGTTCALAFSTNPTAGNTLVYLCSGNGSSALSAATDNNSNTIVNANSKTNGGGGALRVDYVASANSGATTVTCTQTGGTRVHTHIWEISGLASKVFDVGNTAFQTGTAQSISTSSPSTAANEIVFGYFYDVSTNDTFTAGSGFNPTEYATGGAGEEASFSEVEIVSSTGTQTATATCGSNTNQIIQSVATFK